LIVNKKNMGIRNAFVWLQAPVKGQKLPVHPNLVKIDKQAVEVDQPCCMFIPHALGLRQGQDLKVKNSSPVAHSVKWTGFVNDGGNQILPAGGFVLIDGLKPDRTAVKLECTIHPWMNGWVRVFDHPYFALTDENGKFQIKDAPAGQYRLVIHHEKLGWVTS